MQPEIQDITFAARCGKMLKDNRLEMMIVTILVYSTGLFDQAVTYAGGVC